MKISRRQAAGLLFGGITAFSALPVLAEDGELEHRVPFTGNDALIILENDHMQIHKYLDRLVEHVEDRHAVLRDLGMLFTIHNATEENFVYPAIGAVANRKQDASLLYHEQDEAKMVVWSLGELLRLHPSQHAEFTAKAKKLRAAALAHVAQEQNVDFPALQTALGAEGMDYLTKQIREFRQNFT